MRREEREKEREREGEGERERGRINGKAFLWAFSFPLELLSGLGPQLQDGGTAHITSGNTLTGAHTLTGVLRSPPRFLLSVYRVDSWDYPSRVSCCAFSMSVFLRVCGAFFICPFTVFIICFETVSHL